MIPGSGYVGSTQIPISTAFVSTVLKLLSEGVLQLRRRDVVTLGMSEDHISQHLDETMYELHRGSYSDIMNWALRPSHTQQGCPTRTSEVDFSFHFDVIPRNNRTYLGVEAKKLRGTGSSLAASYVTKGVCRFVNGRYSLGHDHAVMLGYVVVGPMDQAVGRVESRMDALSSRTEQQDRFADASSSWGRQNVYSSRHVQVGATHSFTLLHLFADLSSGTIQTGGKQTETT